MNWTNKYEWVIYLVVIVILGIIYFASFNVAYTGYGYSGYRGYHRHHSYWYHRDYDESYDPSVREDSVNGNKFSKRGLSGGK